MTVWNEATPAGTEYISGGDDNIRDFKAATRERLAREHAMFGSGDDPSDGKHRLAHGLAANRPAAVAGHVYIATDTLIVSFSPVDGIWIDLRADDPPGFIKLYAGVTAPSGWLLCDGSAISRVTYVNLFNVIGGYYGVGDGVNTFNLPNTLGRVAVGIDATQAEFAGPGYASGEKTHILTLAELAAHNHSVADPGHSHTPPNVDHVFAMFAAAGGSFGFPGGTTAPLSAATAVNTTGVTINNNGGGGAHNNLQPYISLNYVIKY